MTSTRQGRTQAERRATSERRLLEATARVIAQRGTTGVSFADIAKAAGCSHGLPGYLFGSKTDLLLASCRTCSSGSAPTWWRRSSVRTGGCPR